MNEERASRCTYEPRQRPRPTPAFQKLANKLSGPSNLFTVLDSNESIPSLPPSLAPCERPSPPTARLPWEHSSPIDNQIGLGLSSDVSVAHSIRGATECVSRFIGPSFPIPPSIHFQTTPRPLQVPLSLSPPERIQTPFLFKGKPNLSDSSSLWANSEDSPLPTPYNPSSGAGCIPECAHDGEKDPRSWGGYPLHGIDGHISLFGGAEPVKVPAVISTHPPSRLSLVPSTSDPTRVVTCESSAVQVFKAGHVPHERSSGLAFARRNSFKRRVSLYSHQSTPIILSFPLPTIPLEPWIPLSFLGEERLRVQFSEVDATDLDMRSCVLK